MKPTTPGYYWHTGSYTRRDTGELCFTAPEIVIICLELPPRARKPSTPKILMVAGHLWHEPLSKLLDTDKWSGPIPCPWSET